MECAKGRREGEVVVDGGSGWGGEVGRVGGVVCDCRTRRVLVVCVAVLFTTVQREIECVDSIVWR